MTWRTHALLGIGSLWLISPVPGAISSSGGWNNAGVLAAVAVFGALLPDLDATQSKIRSLSMYGIRPFVPLSRVANRAWGHRGFLHSMGGLVLAGLVCAIFAWWNWQPAFALWLGYVSHLASDACTVSGIPIRAKRPVRLYLLPRRLRFVTGSQAEDALLPLLALVCAALLLRYLGNPTP